MKTKYQTYFMVNLFKKSRLAISREWKIDRMTPVSTVAVIRQHNAQIQFWTKLDGNQETENHKNLIF